MIDCLMQTPLSLFVWGHEALKTQAVPVSFIKAIAVRVFTRKNSEKRGHAQLHVLFQNSQFKMIGEDVTSLAPRAV